MLKYSFAIYGHENILSTHKRTIEFTKDAELTKNGDCIVGVKSDFSLSELKKFLELKKIKITVAVDDIKDTITATPNKNFNSNHELVIRMGEFDSERTFAVRADKSSNDLHRALVNALKSGVKAIITISETIGVTTRK